MSRRFMRIFAFVLVVSVFIGWLRAGLVVVDSARAATAWPYGETLSEVSDPYAALVARVKASGFFPLSPLRLAERQTPGQQDNDEGIPPFPKIVAASIVDGMPRVYLRSKDGIVKAAGGGETLESGWQLKTVDLHRVIAVYDGQESEFQITKYEEHEGVVSPEDASNE
ncbi:MAG: hypothetical protein JKY96_07320 [Phycisphaerales bacterium]|nr:hypothetical protein [Phycisphaerales bacterium]